MESPISGALLKIPNMKTDIDDRKERNLEASPNAVSGPHQTTVGIVHSQDSY